MNNNQSYNKKTEFMSYKKKTLKIYFTVKTHMYKLS